MQPDAAITVVIFSCLLLLSRYLSWENRHTYYSDQVSGLAHRVSNHKALESAVIPWATDFLQWLCRHGRDLVLFWWQCNVLYASSLAGYVMYMYSHNGHTYGRPQRWGICSEWLMGMKHWKWSLMSKIALLSLGHIALCYRCRMACWSVCWSWPWTLQKWLDQDAIHSRNHVLDGSLDSPGEAAVLEGRCGLMLALL